MLPDDSRFVLHVEQIVTGYKNKQVLDGVTIQVKPGEIVALIGHNGAGKSTLLKGIFGVIPIWSGRVSYCGKVISKPEPHKLLQSGMAYVPQGNRVFTSLSVLENLKAAGTILDNKSRTEDGIERALKAYPALKERLRQRAGTLSGGEQQMLALAMSLVLSPKLLLLDEPSLGLAPPLVSQAMHRIESISRDSGVAVVIVEQKVREVLRIANRVYVLRTGRVSFTGPTEELLDDSRLREVYL